MPGQDYPDHTPEAAVTPGTETQQTGLSRRSMLRRTSVVGAAGLAVAAGGGGALAAVFSSQSHGNLSAQTASEAADSDAIVIYMPNPKSGEIQIFTGTGVSHRRDFAMANMAISMAPR
jgi:nitrous oxide reductase